MPPESSPEISRMTQHSSRETESETALLQDGRMLKSVWRVMYFVGTNPALSIKCAGNRP